MANKYINKRDFMDLRNVSMDKTIDSKKLSSKLSGLKWVSCLQPNNPEKEIAQLLEVMEIIKNDNTSKSIITDYQFFDTLLKNKIASPNKFYDGQGVMVRKNSGIKSTNDFKSGLSACVNIGTTTELNMRDFFTSKGISYEPVVFEKADEVVAAYDSGRCDTYTTDKSGLAAQRTKMQNPDDHIVLPETISKEPLGPVVRQGDAVWEDIVRWSLNAMIEAEEYGINSGNADAMKTSENPQIKRLVGAEGELGASLGLDNDWSLRIIKQVGNYGESLSLIHI